MDFVRDGKQYIAGKGYFRVCNVETGKELLSAFDIFQDFNENNKKYTEDFVVKCYETLSKIFDEEFNDKGDNKNEIC